MLVLWYESSTGWTSRGTLGEHNLLSQGGMEASQAGLGCHATLARLGDNYSSLPITGSFYALGEFYLT